MMNVLRILRRSLSTSPIPPISVLHDEANLVFRSISNGTEVGHLEYRYLNNSTPQAIDFHHTFTSPTAQVYC